MVQQLGLLFQRSKHGDGDYYHSRKYDKDDRYNSNYSNSRKRHEDKNKDEHYYSKKPKITEGKDDYFSNKYKSDKGIIQATSQKKSPESTAEPKIDKPIEKKTPVSIQLNPKTQKEVVLQKKKPIIASVFNQDSDSDQEEMPLECRMKMRNIGRNTITSAGPKSFNKGKQGFTHNSYTKFELSMKPRNSMEKQTEFDGK